MGSQILRLQSRWEKRPAERKNTRRRAGGRRNGGRGGRGGGRGTALISAGNGPGIELREHVDATGRSWGMAPTGRRESSRGQGGQAPPAHCSGRGATVPAR